jgi:hypothetical protein
MHLGACSFGRGLCSCCVIVLQSVTRLKGVTRIYAFFYFYPWQFATFHNFHHLIAAVSGTHLQTSAAAQMHASSASQKHLRYYLLQMTSRLLFVTI